MSKGCVAGDGRRRESAGDGRRSRTSLVGRAAVSRGLRESISTEGAVKSIREIHVF